MPGARLYMTLVGNVQSGAVAPDVIRTRSLLTRLGAELLLNLVSHHAKDQTTHHLIELDPTHLLGRVLL